MTDWTRAADSTELTDKDYAYVVCCIAGENESWQAEIN